MNESCHAYQCRHVESRYICATCIWHALTCHIHIQHCTFICVTWLMCHVAHMNAAWLDVMHSYVWHDSFICVTWLIHTCDMTHVPCRAYECGKTRTYEWVMSRVSCGVTLYMRNMHMTWLDVPYSCTTWHIHMCDMTHVSCRTYECGIHIRMTGLDMTHSCTTWLICHVAHMNAAGLAHMNESCHVGSHYICATCIWHDWTCHIHVRHDSCVMSHIWMRHWLDMSHSFTTWLMCHVAHMNAAFIYEWHDSTCHIHIRHDSYVMSQIWSIHVTHMIDHTSILQNIVSFTGLFCKRDL